MTYRSDVDALAARTNALAAEVQIKTRELETSRSLLDDAVAKSKLPVLPNIRIATPCTADWNAMSGDERVRACGSCNKNVYNLSNMLREEAESIIREKEGRLCVRYFQRKDGTILLKDCSVGIKQKRKRRVLAVGVAALLGGGVFAAIRLSRPTPEVKAASVDVAPFPESIVVPIPPAELEEPLDQIMGGLTNDVHMTMGAVAIDPTPAPEPREGQQADDGNIVVK